MEKLKVAVIFGGKSTEHEVSRVSAASVIRNLDKNKYDILMLGITKDGNWHLFSGPVEDVESGAWEYKVDSSGFYAIEKCCKQASIIFPVLHGLYGEDGTIQGFLELMNKPYVGCGVIGSALGMDKAFAKIIFEHYGIPQAKYLVIRENEFIDQKELVVGNIEKEFTYPCFIKPSNSGSSVGISKAHNREELITALELASEHDNKIVIEEFVDCREIECAVLGNENPIASVIGEVIPSREFYDYDSKYNDGTSVIIIPAEVDEDTSSKVREYAVKAYKALDCFGMSRVDFFINKKTNQIYLNEINTIPGFTSISMYPKLFEASGISYSELLDKLIELAQERFVG